jgi:IS1 family transposase
MNKLTPTKRAAVLTALVEGNSIRSTVRMTGVAKNTIVRLLKDAGEACAAYQDQVIRNVPSRRIQCDEIWSFVYGKDRNIPREVRESSPFVVGSVWTWTAIDADSKLMVSWLVGQRNEQCAAEFINDLASRIIGKIQMTTDGLKLYINAIERAFGGDINYAMLTKLYGASGNDNSAETATHRDASKDRSLRS